ncbi:hypothetical protein F2Q69_00014285 [Brassica cretica]|uniref:Uncharacterized protein n=1 Tax=Brassica cretica TaxID=69181 RepID=A0A8S9QRN9_BRACR|nr:hypothetical protein F2Q69_00014285 [Brassica cretica]
MVLTESLKNLSNCLGANKSLKISFRGYWLGTRTLEVLFTEKVVERIERETGCKCSSEIRLCS